MCLKTHKGCDRMVLIAKRLIRRNEEIVYDYGDKKECYEWRK